MLQPIQCINEKSAQRRRKHCALDVVSRSQKFRTAADPLPVGAGRPKFNQLETVTYLYLQSQFGEDRCTQFRAIVVTGPPTQSSTHNKHTHPQTGPITIHCAAASAQCNYAGHIINHRCKKNVHIKTSLCGRDGRTICGPLCVPKSTCVSL